MREQLSPSLSIREPKDRPKELTLAEKTKLPKIEQEMFTERMDDADKIFRMQASEEKIIDILEKTEPSSLEQREATDILQNELLRLFRELKESIQYAKDILASQKIKKEMLAKKEEKPKFTEPAWAKKEGMLIDVPKPKDENEELKIYILDIVSKWSALQELSKEFFLPSQEVERIKEKMESTKQEIDKLRKLSQEYRKMAKAPEETVPQLDKEEERLNQKIADLETQIEPQEKLCPDLRESDFLTDQSKLEILKNIAEISKNIDDLKLPAIEPEKNLEEVFHITKEGALQSEEIGDTYRLILQGAPRHWGEKMQKWVEGLKENDKTKKFAEFMENLRLPRFVSEASMAGAMILMGGYLLGGCTEVEHVKADGEKTEEQLTPEQIAEKREIEMVSDALHTGVIKIKHNPATDVLETRNGEFVCRWTAVDNLDEHWTRKLVQSKMFERIKKCEQQMIPGTWAWTDKDRDIKNIETEEADKIFQPLFSSAENLAKKMNINWETIRPEQLIKIISICVAEHLSYDYDRYNKFLAKQPMHDQSISETIKKQTGICADYSATAEYLANYLIRKHNIPNVHIESIIASKVQHTYNIAHVVDKQGNITVSVFDPGWIDSKTGELHLANLDAFEWRRGKLFTGHPDDMIEVMAHLQKPKIEKGRQDFTFINTAVNIMMAVYKEANDDKRIALARRILEIFPNYANDLNEQCIVRNFLGAAIQNEITAGSSKIIFIGTKKINNIESPTLKSLSDAELREQSLIHYPLAKQLCKIGDELFPSNKFSVPENWFTNTYKDQIPK